MTVVRLLVMGVLLGMMGCAAVRDQGFAPGSTLVLHEALTVPVGHSRVFLQAGAVVAKGRLDGYRPHCNLELREVAVTPVVIEADTFSVRGVAEGEESVVNRAPRRYAARLRLADDTPGMVSRYLHYLLGSPRQPQVMRLSCHGGMDYPGRALAPTLAEMRQALGGFVSLDPAP